MNFKRIVIGTILLIFMTLSGCAYYAGEDYDHPYHHHSYYEGHPYYHGRYDNDRDYHHGQGDNEHFEHHDEGRD